MPDHLQDHATDEEKLASSTNQKWAARHDVHKELTSDVQDFPQPSDLTAFVNESSLPAHSHGESRGETEQMLVCVCVCIQRALFVLMNEKKHLLVSCLKQNVKFKSICVCILTHFVCSV